MAQTFSSSYSSKRSTQGPPDSPRERIEVENAVWPGENSSISFHH